MFLQLRILIFIVLINKSFNYPTSTNYPPSTQNSGGIVKIPNSNSSPQFINISPVDIMVDTTNRLAFNILHLHSITNKNNIALSPCGLVSVLVALYEGSAGRSAIEIQQALEFPWERDVIRIGYRDIHRRLRVNIFYFMLNYIISRILIHYTLSLIHP